MMDIVIVATDPMNGLKLNYRIQIMVNVFMNGNVYRIALNTALSYLLIICFRIWKYNLLSYQMSK